VIKSFVRSEKKRKLEMRRKKKFDNEKKSKPDSDIKIEIEMNKETRKELLIVNPQLLEDVESGKKPLSHLSSYLNVAKEEDENVSIEDAKKAILDNMKDQIRGNQEYKQLTETTRLLHQLLEEGSTALERILEKDFALPKNISKLITNFNNYVKIFHDVKAFPNSKKLKIAICIIKELSEAYPSTFVSYQRIYDVCFAYSDFTDLNIKIKERDDPNTIPVGKFLQTCQNLSIYYTVRNILTQNFLMSACSYLINKFAAYRQNTRKDDSYIITPKNMKTLKDRYTKQVNLYLSKVDIRAVEDKIQKQKTSNSSNNSSSSSSSSSSSTSISYYVSLDMTVLIPSVILILACENMIKDCTFHISGQEMAKVINYSDSTISSTKALMLIEKNPDAEKTGLHKIKERKAAASVSMVGGQGKRLECGCKSGTFRTGRCACFKAGIKCTSKCHRGINKYCVNKEYFSNDNHLCVRET
jgi:hypothetical protein